MSFEGYWQLFCQKGHYLTSAYDYRTGGYETTCCDAFVNGKPCEAPIAYHNLVDTTNGDEAGLLDVKSFQLVAPGSVENDERYQLPGEPCFMCSFRQDARVMKTVEHYPGKICRNCHQRHFP